MLKPTESPPASLQPRFAASITPGPPPVTTAKPASANAPAVARACSYVGAPSAMRADPKIETAGTVDLLDELESGEELRGDERDVCRQRLLASPEDPARQLDRHRQKSRSTYVADIASPSTTTSPR